MKSESIKIWMNQKKRYIGFVLVISVEILLFFRRREMTKEMFFMVWGFVFIGLLLNNLMSRKDRPLLMGLGGNDATRAAYQAVSRLEMSLNPKESTKKNQNIQFSSYNILYGIAIIANIIGYVMVMPK